MMSLSERAIEMKSNSILGQGLEFFQSEIKTEFYSSIKKFSTDHFF